VGKAPSLPSGGAFVCRKPAECTGAGAIGREARRAGRRSCSVRARCSRHGSRRSRL